jgi:glyoxylase-like metal-dependent hydrolase (beta-lactamase superfamily II)
MKVVMPTVFPKPGTYSTNKVHVNIMSLTNDALVYYTLDGSEPTRNSTIFNMADGLLTLKLDDPAAVDENKTNQDTSKEKDFVIKAMAVKEGYQDSDIAIYNFSLKSMSKDRYFYTILQNKEPGSPAVIRIEDEYQVKMYFVIGSERALLIDAGFNKENDLKGLLDTMAGGLPYDAVITHAHPDHDAQAQSLIDQGITVYMNDEEMATYNQFGGSLSGFIDFKEGYEFYLGDCTLKTYKIPGHTKGHMVLFDEENGLLFSSDALGNNRNTLMDTAFPHLGGGVESTMDQLLSVVQNFRNAAKGKIHKIFFGHNDHILGESYMENFEKAVQKAVDLGEEALSPTLRPAAECMNSSKISLVGNYISELDWVGININTNFSRNYTAENIATLSAIFVENGRLEPKFHPAIENYTLQLDTDAAVVELSAVSTSTRIESIRINSAKVNSKEFYTINIEQNKEIHIQVIAPNGIDEKN